MNKNKKNYIIVHGEKVLARCYTKEEVRDRLRELLNVLFQSELEYSEKYQSYIVRVDVWIQGSFSGHSYRQEVFSSAEAETIWRDVLKSEWFYNDTGIEIFETCPTLE